MFHLMFTLPGLYVIVRFLLPLPLPVLVKGAAVVLVLLASQYHLFSRWSSGSVFDPEMPRALIILFNWAFAAIVLLAFFQLAVDAVTGVASLMTWNRLTIAPNVRYGIGIAAMVLSAIGVHQAIRVPPLKDIQIAVRDLPPAFEGYRLLQLTDMHLSRLFTQRWAQAVVDKTHSLDVDLIVITGDLIDGPVESRINDVAPLKGLNAPDGVYFIPGNHEYFFDYTRWMKTFTDLGMRPLANSHAVLERAGDQLVLAGVTDLSARSAGLPGPDLNQAINGAPKNAPIILLDHQPRKAREAAKKGVAVQLSGHTHGGLVWGLDRLFRSANGGFVNGHYDVDGMSLYVNNGTALWPGMALRLGRPSELTRITLTRANP